MAIKINSYSCTGCGTCVLLCPSDVLRLDEENKATPVYNSDCVSCRLCEMSCPFECIEVVIRPFKTAAETFPVKQYLLGLGVDPSTLPGVSTH